jgi:hypothetical protein
MQQSPPADITYAVLRGGIVLFVLAAVAALGHHLLPHPMSHSLDPLVGPNAINAHVLLLVAMAVLLLGAVLHGLRRRA